VKPAYAAAARMAALVVLVVVGGLAACRSAPSAPAAARDAGASPSSLVAARPYALTIPRSGAAPRPLVLLLHGYGDRGKNIDAAWGFSQLAEREGFLLAAPDGTPDARGRRFWNAGACCQLDPGAVAVDDVAYVRAILDDVAARTPLDPARVFVVGHSNGGFMAHRLACDLSDRVAAVVSMAGAVDADPARCSAPSPVSVVQAHGTADAVVAWSGGQIFDLPGRTYPSVAETMRQWSARLACAGGPEEAAARLDLDATLAGAETRVDRYRGCRAGLELWTIEQGAHTPAFTSAWAEAVWAFFRAHPKPR
jgi:polyhydroxybutyrate depolymerase